MGLRLYIPTELTGHSSYIMITARLRQLHLTTPVSGMIFMTDETGNRFGSLISHHNHLNVLAYKTSALICPEVLIILDAVSLRTYTLVV